MASRNIIHLPPEREAKIEQRACKKIFEMYGIDNIKLKLFSRSYPDRLFFVPGGKPLMIEFKRPGEALRKFQAYTIKRLKKLGYDIEVCDSSEDALKLVAYRLKQATTKK
jgi:hypothetical protein